MIFQYKSSENRGSHTNVFGVEIELLFLDCMVFMLPVMAYLSLDLIQFSKIFLGIRSAEIKFPNSHACFIEPLLAEVGNEFVCVISILVHL